MIGIIIFVVFLLIVASICVRVVPQAICRSSGKKGLVKRTSC